MWEQIKQLMIRIDILNRRVAVLEQRIAALEQSQLQLGIRQAQAA